MTTLIDIPFNKKKLTWIITASIFFIIFCIFMVVKADWIGEDNETIKLISKLSGVMGTLFFIYNILNAINKRKSNAIGFSITKKGFYDNSSGAKLGLVSWKDIAGFREWTFESTKSLIILVNNPEEYIALEKGFLVKKMLQANYTGFGSPIIISAVSLSITYEKLKENVINAYENYNETTL